MRPGSLVRGEKGEWYSRPHFSGFDAELKWVSERIEMNEKAGQLVEELETINKRVFQIAVSVHKDSSLRSHLAEEASPLKKRLLDIAEEIEQIDPAVHKQWFHRISESLLDLDFVVANSGITSLRLGDVIKWGK